VKGWLADEVARDRVLKRRIRLGQMSGQREML
jgi:hypothetical protein